jgi:D-sedoheptulose 7-phosphate isomerase
VESAAKVFERNADELAALLPRLKSLSTCLEAIAKAFVHCWQHGGKVLIAGNGGSAADAMHFAEELSVRFRKNRKALAALSLCDPTVITCAANDFGYDVVFSRQVEALGRPGDVLVVLSTSGNSDNLLRAVNAAKALDMVTVALLGKDGGKLRGQCALEFIVPSQITHHVQEGHKLAYHALCEWIDTQYE